MARKRGQLRSSTKEHAERAEQKVYGAENSAKLAMTGSCGLRLTSLVDAYEKLAAARAQAFASGGRVAKGALTPRTVNENTAKRIYEADDLINSAASDFRKTCLR